jgi:hypothetical protein
MLRRNPEKASPQSQFTLIHERGTPANERHEVGHFEGESKRREQPLGHCDVD